LMLPKRGGFDLLKAIRSDGRHKDTPVLILSNAYLPDLAQRALRAGGNKALTRSECTSSDLISASRELIGITGNEADDEAAAVNLSEQVKKSLLQEGRAEVATTRQLFAQYVQVIASADGKDALDKVYQSVRSLSSRAGLAGFSKISQLS